MYAHGILSATCEFGRFQDFRNCYDIRASRRVYVDTLKPVAVEQVKFLRALDALGFKIESDFYRVRFENVNFLSETIISHIIANT